jgi:hypothetical protein
VPRFPAFVRLELPLLLVCLTSGCLGDDTEPHRDQTHEFSSDAGAGDAGPGSEVWWDASGSLSDARVGIDVGRPRDGGTTDAEDGDAGAGADASQNVGPRSPSPRAPRVTVTGPISGGMGKPFALPPPADFTAEGYIEEEFFFEGGASAYTLQGEKTLDGKWSVTASSRAEYKSRLLVRRPKDAARFNGTVVVEWFNVSAGFETDPGFRYAWEEAFREGYVWVGVSAQFAGVEGGGLGGLLPLALALTGIPDVPNALKMYDPMRYGTLFHPGDAYSFDIFTQVAQVIRHPGGVDVLSGLEPKHLIAYGESQSAGRIKTYVNAVHPLVKEFDGFFIHSGAFSAPLNDTAEWSDTPDLIRTDLQQPIMNFMTETDLFQIGKPSIQSDHEQLRTWEVAGTAHVDTRVVPGGVDLGCGMMNDGPQHFVVKAALHALNRWIGSGAAPAHAERLARDRAGSPVHDEHGNMRGGVRTPHVDVPIATHTGLSSSLNPLCAIFGQTLPFESEKLKQLYPMHEDYVAKVAASARAIREAGFLLDPEERAIVAAAEAANVP